MNILIVRLSSLGDILHNMPMIVDIHYHYPHANIDWVAEETYVSLIKLNPYIRHIFPIALRRWRNYLYSPKTYTEIICFYKKLREYTYDFVFDTQGLLKTSIVMRMTRLVFGGKRIGLANATKGSGYESISRIFHTHSISVDIYTHAVTRARILAAVVLKYKLNKQINFGLQVPISYNFPTWLLKMPFVIFFHGTTRVAKKWPMNHWIAIAKELNKQGILILLPWSNAIEKKTAKILASNIFDVIILPNLTLINIIILLKYALLIIGLDTGLTHIAAALCCRTIELYCDSPRWKTEGNWSSQIINLGDHGVIPTIEEVIQAISKLILTV